MRNDTIERKVCKGGVCMYIRRIYVQYIRIKKDYIKSSLTCVSTSLHNYCHAFVTTGWKQLDIGCELRRWQNVK